jgi:hypothetical protein
MNTFRLSAKPATARPAPERQSREVFRRFFDLIEKLERPHKEGHAPAPEVKARISRLDDAPRRHA